MKKRLIYLTLGYPGDMYSEKVFAESQLEALRTRYDGILIVPLDRVGNSRGYESQLPEGISADWALADDPVIHSRLRRLPYLFHPFVASSLVNMVGEAKSLRDWGKGFFQAVNTHRISKVLSNIATAHGMTPRDTDIFSLWFYDSAAGAALMARNTDWKVYTSAHSADLYDCTRIFRSRSLRNRLLGSITKVYPISQHGLDYLRRRYPDHADRFELRRLGSRRLFEPASQRPEHSNIVNFITVARLVPLKRVGLALDVMSLLARRMPDITIRYNIIGDGECYDSLREKAAAIINETGCHNLEISFFGSLENNEIQRIYANNPPDWFMLLSETEGVPVSIGEAMSYGIPVIATDVGQVAELVTSDCGILLASDATAQQMADRIANALQSQETHAEMAAAAIRRWAAIFNADTLHNPTAQ